MSIASFGPEAVIYDDGTLARNVALMVVSVGTSTPIPLYSNINGSVALANPVSTDGDGNLFFYAEQGQYELLYGGARVPIANNPIGATGPKGDKGDPGETGPAGGAASTYVHDQGTPSALWTIAHGLGYFPNVTIVDSGGTQVVPDVIYPDMNTVEIAFSAAFGGKAYLS